MTNQLLTTKPKNHYQLFCFTFAGGTASFFDQIEKDLGTPVDNEAVNTVTSAVDSAGSMINVIKLEYAGHGARHREPLYRNYQELADDLFDQFQHLYAQGVGNDYALFGYSMGTITLVEVLRRILASVLPAPKHIFLAAHEPHTKAELLTFTPDEMDEWVKDRTIKFGTVPEKLLNNKTYWRMYLPLYRHDYTLLAHYDFENLSLETDIPATIFYSETDTPLKEMKLWEKYFRGHVEYCRYKGQHFFIQQHHEEMARVIIDRLITPITLEQTVREAGQ